MDFTSPLIVGTAFGAFVALAVITAYKQGMNDCALFHKDNAMLSTISSEELWGKLDHGEEVKVEVSSNEAEFFAEELSYEDQIDAYVAAQRDKGVVFSAEAVAEMKNVEPVC